MDKDVQEKFDKIDQRFDELMVFLRDNVATKEDLKQFATKEDLLRLENKVDGLENKVDGLENKMDAGFSSIRSELRAINERLDALEERMERLEKRTDEDYGALVQDLLDLKKRVRILELSAQQQGL